MYDLLLKNGTVIDGSGREAYRADLAVRDGRIAAIAPKIDRGLSDLAVDIAGLVAAPGFIDIHSHSDLTFLEDDRGEAKLYQGVTSELCGNCGESPFPYTREREETLKTEVGNTGKGNFAAPSLERFLRGVEERGDRMGTNLLPLVGHGTLRAGVLGYEDRPAAGMELEKMADLLRADLESGAWGLSLGLGYTPGLSADVDELSGLGRVVAPFNGIITSHMRNQRAGTPESLEEMFEINRRSGAHVHIAHFKASGPDCRGRAGEWIDILETAKSSGVDVTADVYPYTAANSGITNSFPKWAITGGKGRALEAVYGAERGRLLSDLEDRFPGPEEGESLLIVHTAGRYPELEGLSLEEISRIWAMPRAEALAKLCFDTAAKADCVTFCMAEEDVERMLRQNDFSIGSDGCCLPLDPALNQGKPHPRNYGTFPRFLRLAREKSLCSPETAIRRITGLSADYIGLGDRGYLREGMAADITVLDWNRVSDRATYSNPFQKPEGIVHVLMNGRFAVRGGMQTEERQGRILLKR